MTFCASVLQADGPMPLPETRKHNIDIILPDDTPRAASKMIEDLFGSANDLLPGSPYQVVLRDLGGQPIEDARYWSRRTVVFPYDIRNRWTLNSAERARVHQILRLAHRVVLVGGAVFILGETSLQDRHECAIHPNFVAAASEEGLSESSPGTHTAMSGKLFSAISPLAALPLFLDLIGADQGRSFRMPSAPTSGWHKRSLRTCKAAFPLASVSRREATG